MGISIRAYSRHRGCSDTAVHKAIKSGRITKEPDGTIDPDKADKQWELNTDAAQQRETPATPAPELPTHGTTLLQAKTANEVLKAQTSKLKLKQLKGDLIDKAQATAHVFRLARQERDAWISWPSRVAAQMAAELDIEPHTMHVTLERYVRQHLGELADIQPRLGDPIRGE